MKMKLMAAMALLVVLTTLSSCLVAVRPAYGGYGYHRGPRPHYHHHYTPRPHYYRGW